MNEIILTESQSLRAQLCSEDNIDVLNRIGTLVTLPDTAWATTENVAKFYQVPKNTIEYVVKRHLDEFLVDGYKIINSKDLENWHSASFKIPNRGLAIFTKRAVLRCGCLLRDSVIAKNVRTFLVSLQSPEIQSPSCDMALSQMAQLLNQNAEQLSNHARELVDQSRMIVAIVNEVNKNRESIYHLQTQVDLNTKEIAAIQSFQKTLAPQYLTPGQIDILRAQVRQKAKGNPNNIWRKLNRYFGVSRYKHIPRSEFEKALKLVESY